MSIPVERSKLIQFTNQISKDYPGFNFDFGEMDKMKTKNLWFIEVIQHQIL